MRPELDLLLFSLGWDVQVGSIYPVDFYWVRLVWAVRLRLWWTLSVMMTAEPTGRVFFLVFNCMVLYSETILADDVLVLGLWTGF